MMSKSLRFLSIILLLTAIVTSCTTVPITGRQQLNLVPRNQLMAMSFQSYKDFLKNHRICHDPVKVAMVQRVGENIKHAVEDYLTRKEMSYILSGYHWEFNLIEDKAINAWCMPGGKVVVYTGILPVARDDNGLAVVLGHEIAHAIANHGAERMSQALAVQLGGMALSSALAQENGSTRRLFMAAYGLGAQIGLLLPYSRLQEEEADHLGLIFMALAGYDPRKAVVFWERMMALGSNKERVPEFLSTHPSDASRIARIKALLPEALGYYYTSKRVHRFDKIDYRPENPGTKGITTPIRNSMNLKEAR